MPTQSMNRNTTWNIDTSNDTWTLAQNATITTEGEDGVFIGADFTGNDIHIEGDVIRTGGVYNIEVQGNDNHFFIGKHAQIGGAPLDDANVGIGFLNASGTVDNAGLIRVDLTGIVAGAGTEIINTGRIEAVNSIFAALKDFSIDNQGKLLGEKFGVDVGGDDGLIVNRADGVIKGGSVGINFDDAAASTLRNFGTISGPQAIFASGGDIQILNRGTLHGDVILGNGEDKFDTRGGSVTGTVDAGGGSDTYLIGSQSILIAENADSGNDLVKSTVSYTLGKNLENLTLLGHKNVDGSGNTGANTLLGNSGDNMLKGLGGSDNLFGGKGDDVLTGGNGADLFVFNHGDDHDTIADFQDGKDVIFTDFVNSEEDFNMMLADHVKVKGDDLLLQGKHDSLLIRNMDINHLDYSDFFTGP